MRVDIWWSVVALLLGVMFAPAPAVCGDGNFLNLRFDGERPLRRLPNVELRPVELGGPAQLVPIRLTGSVSHVFAETESQDGLTLELLSRDAIRAPNGALLRSL